MKIIATTFCFSLALIVLGGCAGNSDQESAVEPSENNAATEANASETEESASTEDAAESGAEQKSEASSEESATVDPETAASEQEEDPLAGFSNEQIEYARIWLQLGANQEIDGLYVNKIPAGTTLNPDDETSGIYPENVIQLAGSRLVDGSITYSGNGEGMINVYNVPLRWDGQYPAGEDFYEKIIENTELVAVDTGDDEGVIRLIELLEDQP